MAAAYTVLLVIAVMGVGLGWRLTPPRSDSAHPVGLPRLLQLGIAGTAVAAMLLLLVPWISGLDQATCVEADYATGHCVAGLREQALFGSAIFAWMVGAGLAFVIRKGVIDYPLVNLEGEELPESTRPGREDLPPSDKPAKPVETIEPAKPVELTKPIEPVELTKPIEPKPIEPEPAPPTETTAPVEDEVPDPRPREPSGLMPWRRLTGPAFRAFVDDHTATLEEAIQTAAKRLRANQVAAVFSRGASKEANLAMLELANALHAHRYVLEGTAAATEGVPVADKPDPHEADGIAGPDARHAGELALDLAGSLIETVMLIDTRVAFPEFVLGKLIELQSVCIAHAHDAVSGACQVLLPGTNPGEREGELAAEAGQTNDRRTREWLVQQIVVALRELESSEAQASASETPSEPDSEIR